MASRRTGTTADDSDTDERFMDVYETPLEVGEHKFSAETAQRQHMTGMI
jgi:hypothetical protein